MMYSDPSKIRRVTSIGAGPIGAGWAAHFLARGYDVTAYLHDSSETKAFNLILKTAWFSLTKLGLAEGASLARLSIVTDLETALDNADFVQESAPERLNIKQDLYKKMGDILPESVVIGSSTSGLTMTEIQASCASPERCVIGHPFNPPYLLPLVEIVGGDKTAIEAVSWAGKFYEIAGKAPLIMKKEIPGFVATRLQEALWREALHMVANGEATPKDIDIALMNGPAPRMVSQGQCLAFHVACGAGGMATNLDQFGPALKLPWTRLEAPELTSELRNRMVDGCNAIAGEHSFEDMAAQRDREIVAVLSALRQSRLG
ncbi:MAG: 3-hydroxybutyryl-CoA dehydrogenase [Tateyamaria sp.]|jgi:carnitine 3-dehydrogenase|nr:3-hydroxybutyryl-CoA dehydrogenase [Tateyamaria sp.]MBT7801927.1 3-hydroxybutyryl-CoA dehydrogenase [Tateyamaria sp.]